MAKARPIHEHVHELVKTAKLSYSEIADQTEWNEQQVYRLLTGRTELSADDMLVFARLLGRSVASLYPREARAS